METFRRIVTGHSADGRSVIASDRRVEFDAIPGLGGIVLGTLWGSDAAPVYPDGGGEPSHHAWFPPVGGMRLVEFVLPPNSSPNNPGPRPSEQDLSAAEKLAPGLLSHFDDRNPGMHRSATTDMLYVISGRCELELDDGSKTEIGAGDVVVQSGTMHRWHNPFAEPCRVLGALVGALWTK
jgi:mannose-6-phosphate isomerase-like protein (cupin superfamily)